MTSGNFETRFLNVDLDIHAHEGLEALVKFFRPYTLLLHQSETEASFETLVDRDSIDDSVNDFIRILTSMKSKERVLWEKCESRILNVGIAAGCEPHAKVFDICNETMKSILKFGCTIRVTIYALSRSDETQRCIGS